jgi:hypothetical protein
MAYLKNKIIMKNLKKEHKQNSRVFLVFPVIIRK